MRFEGDREMGIEGELSSEPVDLPVREGRPPTGLVVYTKLSPYGPPPTVHSTVHLAESFSRSVLSVAPAFEQRD